MQRNISVDILENGQLAVMHEGEVKSPPHSVSLHRAAASGVLVLQDGTRLDFRLPVLEPAALATGNAIVVETWQGEAIRDREVPLTIA